MVNTWSLAEWRQKLHDLREAVQSAIRRWFGERRGTRALAEPLGPTDLIQGWPAVEMRDEPERVVVVAEIPGLDPQDIHAEVEGNTLILRGEKRHEREEHGEGGVWFSECWYGAFARYLPLPASVIAEKAVARYRNGRLVIELPKRTPAKRIPVKSS
jgi:HSP20 family protein